MYIVTCLLDTSKTPTEVVIGDTQSLIDFVNFLENKKTVFKVNADTGKIMPELFGWAPIGQWKYWKERLY